MTKHVTVDNATFNADDLTRFLQRALSLQAEEAILKEDYKALVQEAVDGTKLPKKLVNKFFKSRFKVQTKEIVEEAGKLEALSNAVDN